MFQTPYNIRYKRSRDMAIGVDSDNGAIAIHNVPVISI